MLSITVSAQDNGLNPVYKVQLGDIVYQKSEASKKVTVGKVLGVVADAMEGRVTDVHNEEYIPLAANCVREGAGSPVRDVRLCNRSAYHHFRSCYQLYGV